MVLNGLFLGVGLILSFIAFVSIFGVIAVLIIAISTVIENIVEWYENNRQCIFEKLEHFKRWGS